MNRADIADFRDFLMTSYGSDFGVSDEVLIAHLERRREYIRQTGYRYSAKALAAEDLQRAYSGPATTQR